jgi:hypothetical protein
MTSRIVSPAGSEPQHAAYWQGGLGAGRALPGFMTCVGASGTFEGAPPSIAAVGDANRRARLRAARTWYPGRCVLLTMGFAWRRRS